MAAVPDLKPRKQQFAENLPGEEVDSRLDLPGAVVVTPREDLVDPIDECRRAKLAVNVRW